MKKQRSAAKGKKAVAKKMPVKMVKKMAKKMK